jgi:hypothetical protein
MELVVPIFAFEKIRLMQTVWLTAKNIMLIWEGKIFFALVWSCIGYGPLFVAIGKTWLGVSYRALLCGYTIKTFSHY